MVTTTAFSLKPVCAVSVSLIAAFLVMATGSKRRNLREFWSVGAGILKFLIVASMIPAVWSGLNLECVLFRLLPGVEIAFRADAFGLLFALGASLLWIATSFYSVGYMRALSEHAQTRYFACFALAMSATMGVAFAANLFTLFIFYEALTLATYPLVAHKETPEAKAGARKYAIYLLGAAKVFLLAAIVLIYTTTGTLEFQKGGILPLEILYARPAFFWGIFAMFLFGFAKSAIMPMHSWLPAAMVAPTPVSALLHAVAVVKTGVFSMLRVMLFVFGPEAMSIVGADELTLWAAAITILVASVLALGADNLKARLAFSTISQLSYILLGGALLTSRGALGGIIHITNHAFAKITLFFCAGSIYVTAHKTQVSQLSGLAKRMPWTMAAFTLATLSLVGVPPAGGFVSKWNLVLGSLERGSLALMAVLLLSSFFTAAYLGPVVYKAYFEKEQVAEAAHGHEHAREIPWMVVPLVLSAVASVALGFYPNFLLGLAGRALP
ncbi:MAG: monovalent cation/H+ antiporter subunit D family protein [Elusimicrobia bacterium]|nr:monovalent cation/H+ antiporter subunit D family protein [Elusimicrobiota bacterium]